MIDFTKCFICKQPVEGYEPVYCCSGHECGCFGLPTEPPLCDKPECVQRVFGKPDHAEQSSSCQTTSGHHPTGEHGQNRDDGLSENPTAQPDPTDQSR